MVTSRRVLWWPALCHLGIEKLDDESLIAVGYKMPLDMRENRTVETKGVILVSLNHGLTWDEVFQSEKSSKLSFIARLSPSSIITGGNHGEIIALHKK